MKVRLFIEGYEFAFSSISLATGIGVLRAEIVLPPGKNRRKILPGSRVYAIMKSEETDWEWVWWFKGYTTTVPLQTVGVEDQPILLNVIGDMGVLYDTSMMYVYTGQLDVKDMKVRENYNSGKYIVHRNGPGDIFFRFYDLDDKDIDFAGRIQGLLLSLLALNPSSWNKHRRLRSLDYLAIETVNKFADDIGVQLLFSGISHILSNIQQPSITAMDILDTIMEYIFHDFVSIAPIRAGKHYTPDVGSYNYIPNGDKLPWWNFSDMGPASLAQSFCERRMDDNKFFDHLIKPSFESSQFLPLNEIRTNEFLNLYTYENICTRLTLKIPFTVDGNPCIFSEIQSPPILNKMYEIAYGVYDAVKEDGSLVSKSNLLSSRLSGARTNEERVFDVVKHQTITADPRLASLIQNMAFRADDSYVDKQKLALQYLQIYADSELEKLKGIDVSIQSAKYNPFVVPGFYATVVDGNGDKYIGKIIQKIDKYSFIDNECSSSYVFKFFRPVLRYDYNYTFWNATYETIEDTFPKVSSQTFLTNIPTIQNLASDALERLLDISKFVSFESMLEDYGLKEENGILTPTYEYNENIKHEQFYSALDIIPLYFDSKHFGNVAGVPNDVFAMVQDMNFKNIAFLFDTQTLSTFTFVSIIMGNIVKTNPEFSGDKILSLIKRKIKSLPLWLGNPCPDKLDMLLYYLSMMDKNIWRSFIETGVVKKKQMTFDSFMNFIKDKSTKSPVFDGEVKLNSDNAVLPRPISEYQLVKLRRSIAEAAHAE